MNRWVVAVIITVAIILGGLGFLSGIGIVMQKTMAPVGGSLEEIASVQKEIRKKLNDSSATELKAVLVRLDILESKVKALEAQGGEAPSQEKKRPQRDFTTVHEIPVGTSAVFGKIDAPVTIVVFNDFQCPYCSRFYPALLEAANAYPDKVKLVMKHFPLSFHPQAVPAAKAALAAGAQGKFYEMANLLFQNSKSLKDDTFKELAGQLKLNVAQFMKDYQGRDDDWQKQIEADMELAQKIGVGGTPYFYLNGRLTNAGSVEQWKAQIDGVLSGKPVQAPVAGGAAPAQGGGCN